MVQTLMTRQNMSSIMCNPYFERMKNQSDEFVGGAVPVDVKWQIWLPIPICEGSPWTANSRCLADCRFGAKHEPLVDLLQLLLTGTNLCKNGTPSFSVSPKTNRTLYNRVLVAWCKKKMGIAKAEEAKLVERYEKTSSYFDPAMVDLIEKTMAAIRNKETEEETLEQEVEPEVLRVELPAIPNNEDIAACDNWMEAVRANLIQHNQTLRTLTQLQRDFFLSQGGTASEFEPPTIIEDDGGDDLLEKWCAEYLTPLSVCMMESDEISRELVAREISFCSELQVVFSTIPINEGLSKNFPGFVVPKRRCWPVGSNLDEKPPVAPINIADVEVRESQSTNSVPKVHMTMFVVKNRNSNQKDHLMIRFAVLDQNWSLRRVVSDIESSIHFASAQKKKSATNKFNQARDPLENLRRFKNTHIANTYTNQRYLNIIGYFKDKNFNDRVSNTYVCGDMFDDKSNPFHLCHHVTLKKCLSMLSMANGAISPFKELKGLNVTPNADFYVIDPQLMFWAHPTYVGLGFTSWAHEKSRENFALELVLKELVITNGGKTVVKKQNSADPGPLSCFAGAHLDAYPSPLVDKRLLESRSASLLNYRTAEQIMVWQAENDMACKIIYQYMPSDPRLDAEQYATFCVLLKRLRESALDKFLSIWTTDGVVDNKPIDISYKKILETLHVTLKNTSSLTQKIPYLDKRLTVYGNNCVQRMLLLRNGASIYNCKIPFVACSMQSTFDSKRDGKVKVNIQLCGPKEAGKTYPLIGFIEKHFINGTWELIQTQSDRADNVDMHIGPCMLLIDEPPKYFTATNENEKDYEKIQTMKNRTVHHQNQRAVLDTVEIDGENIRYKKKIINDDSRTIGLCTNQPRNKVTALSSRFFVITVSKPTNPCDNSDVTGSATLAHDTVAFFNIEEILVVQVYTALRLGVIPDIDMWLALMVTGRTIDILKAWGTLDKQKGERARQILIAFIRHQIIIRGISACCNTPGGILYDVPYKPEDVVKMAPYFVCTLEICLVALTMMASELIDDDAAIVFKAACKLTGFDHTQTAFENYKLNRAIPFKHEARRSVFVDPTSSSKKNSAMVHVVPESDPVIDLNYLTFRGTIDTICGEIANYTDPALEAAQVKAVLMDNLRGMMYPCPNDEHYKPTKQSDIVKIMTYDGHNDEAHEVIGKNRVFYTEANLKEKKEKICPVIHLEDKKMLFLAPVLIKSCFDVNAIEHAFNQAVVCKTHPQIRALKGLTHDGHGDLFKTCDWTEKWINSFVEKIDTMAPDAPVLRKDGIALTGNGFLSEMESDMLLSIRPNPARTEHYSDYKNVVMERSESFVKIEDWEKTAAERVVFRAGIPQNEWVFYTDSECRRRYEEYVSTHEDDDVVATDMNYPFDIIAGRKKDHKKHTKNIFQLAKTIRESSESVDLDNNVKKRTRVLNIRSSRNFKTAKTSSSKPVPAPPPPLPPKEKEEDLSYFIDIAN
jgi:hypothetical protein